MENYQKKKCRGFTIIELLVIVAILAVLTGVVLINVIPYINKGKDAAIKGAINSIQTYGTIYYEDRGSYSAFCNDAALQIIFNSINSTNKKCKADTNRWVVCAKLNIPTTGSKAWCADYTGVKEEINNSSCKTSLHACP